MLGGIFVLFRIYSSSLLLVLLNFITKIIGPIVLAHIVFPMAYLEIDHDNNIAWIVRGTQTQKESNSTQT